MKIVLLALVVMAQVFIAMPQSNNEGRNQYAASQNSVMIKITRPNGKWVKACVQEGGTLKIKNEATNEYLILIPSLNNNDNKTTVRLYSGDGFNPRLDEFWKLFFSLGLSETIAKSSFDFTLEVKSKPAVDKYQRFPIVSVKH